MDNPDHENLKIIEKDVNDVDLDEITADIDYVFHLSAMVNVPLSIKNPVKCNHQNVTSTVKLLVM